MNGTLTKWDAAMVGEKPPIGRWVMNGKTLKETSEQPPKWQRRLLRLIGREWVVGVDAMKHPACLEVIQIDEGKDPVILYKRTNQ